MIIEPPPRGILGYDFYLVAVLALGDELDIIETEKGLKIEVQDCQLYANKIKSHLHRNIDEQNIFFTGNDKKSLVVKAAKLFGIKSAAKITARDLLEGYADYVEKNCDQLPPGYREIMYPNLFKLNYYELKRDFSNKPKDVRGDLHQIMLMIMGALIAKTGVSSKGTRKLTYYTMIPEITELGKEDIRGNFSSLVSYRRIIRRLVDEPEQVKRLALAIRAAEKKKKAPKTRILNMVYQAVTSEQGNRATLIESHVISIGDEVEFFKKLEDTSLETLKHLVDLYAEASAKVKKAKTDRIMNKIANTLLSFIQYIMLYIETRNPDHMYNAISIIERSLINPPPSRENKNIINTVENKMGSKYDSMLSSMINDLIVKGMHKTIVR